MSSHTWSVPVIKVTTRMVIEEKDLVVHFGTFRATHCGTYINMPASGRIIEWEAI